MAFTRRQFMTRTGILTAGAALGPTLIPHPLLRRALADYMGDKYLVLLQADGGNDGLNTVIPNGNGSYGALRTRYEVVRDTGSGGLQIDESDLTATAIGDDPLSVTPLALHPGLTGFQTLYNAGRLAVIQGCGYPNQDLSHAASRGYWQSGDPLGTVGGNTGWMGRYLIAMGYDALDISSVNVRSSVAEEFVQSLTNVLALTQLSSFTFPYDDYDPADDARKRTAYLALYGAAAASSEPTWRFLGDVGSATLKASEHYPPVSAIYTADRPSWDSGYTALGSGIANNLREVAKVIYATENELDDDVNARFFQVRRGGYDTHSNQGALSGRHWNLHQEVGNAVNHFYDDLANMPAAGGGNVAQKTVIVWWSEFSRRITQNATGTDHGSQGPMFVIGGSVNGGVYGNHPNINVLNSSGNTLYSQGDMDPYRSTDFRDVFGTVLKHWLGLGDPSVVFPADPAAPGQEDKYWTSPEFDLGFLP
jgi:uncharacterized protein (DUF1501 family)